MSKLALFGGPKVREHLFPSQNTYGPEEMEAVNRVMVEGRLSHYRGNWGPQFYGGPEIKALEKEWSKRFHVRNAICCNSATSGLFIALGALGTRPGDEIIVTPWSMTCSATMPLAWGATPVFADVEKNYFCLDPKSVEERITERTKVIIVVSLFGQPYDPKINEIARKHNIKIIEDAAQAVGSTFLSPGGYIGYSEDGKISPAYIYAGTLGDIGVYSFNYGKHLTCGEGGMIVTDNDDIAFRCRLIMNHAESVINDHQDAAAGQEVFGMDHLRSIQYRTMFGFNLRMTEIQAAIIRAQLTKFDTLLTQRLGNVIFLESALDEIPAIQRPSTRLNCTHTYYVLPFFWDREKADGLHRDEYIKAVKAELVPRADRDEEGVQIGCGYIKPIHLMPLFDSSLCFPNVEALWKTRLFLTLYHAPNSTIEDMKSVAEAFHKVWDNKEELIRKSGKVEKTL